MTVCVAAIADADRFPMIVIASDRKYTVGDYQYEPYQTKHFRFSDRAAVLFAGSVAAHTSMADHALSSLAALGAQRSADISLVADIYAQAFADYRKREAERGLLVPLGLTINRLITDPSIPSDTIIRLTRELRQWQLDDAAIIAGIDSNKRAHIYRVVDPGWPSCEDTIGFTAIGSGESHAMAELMHRSYTASFSPVQALLSVYTAKRRAEVDPYVGSMTDICVIGPGDHPYGPLHQDLAGKLIEVYYDMQRAELGTTFDGYRRFEEYVTEFLNKQAPQAEHQEGDETGAIEPKGLPEGQNERDQEDSEP